ncbi:hypothetical protein LX73_0982 [Fodinibius salinus]|uniref:P pilus assembly protein, chaperone PapD n=1 Tax=Fodinibius salinus TaxID=860790 RepID=A0A5D3YPB9_9BACT|nr:hypothetical protein [Fodinibius salinus]TYP95667.1 hypothetical protein LX73_0982 [Fodinibius salinus]
MTSNISSPKKITLLLSFFLLAITNHVAAQISIAPTALFFDQQNRFSSLTVSNGGQQAQEISVSTMFGYTTSKDGEIVIANDSAMAKKKSIADWIKVFPKNFTLQPQQQQTVRFVVRPPNNVSAGGYWSRVQVKSNPVSPPIESVEEGEVGAQVNIVVKQVLTAHFRAREASTGITLNSVNFSQDDSSNTGKFAVSMEQTGNAPFVGSMTLSVKNSDGQKVYQTATTNSVYTTLTRTFTMDLSDIPPGNYTLSGTIRSERRDINQNKLLQIEPVSFQKQFTVK